jgi:hypothetical protein
LTEADLYAADLTTVDLTEAKMRRAVLGGAELSFADLSRTDLSEADLTDARLARASLPGAYLDGTDLRDAVLMDAKGITTEELKEQGASLGGAIMPNLHLAAGRYHTKTFEPPLSFEVSEGWKLALGGGSGEPEEYNRLSIMWAPEWGQLTFTSPLSVFDTSSAAKGKNVPAPKNIDEWISWFQRHPTLKTSKPVSVPVGDTSGRRIDVTVASTLESSPRNDRGQAYVPLYPTCDGISSAEIHSVEGEKNRFFIVNIRDKIVIIDVSAPIQELDAFLSKAQRSLDTIAAEWGRPAWAREE